MPEPPPTLLVTKLFPPRLRPGYISRPRLLAALDAGLARKLILIAAAAGFGKTTLVADWLARRGRAAAWLSLDAGDNDPPRFLSYLVAAIQTRRPEFGQALLAALQSPQPPPPEHALASLVNQLASAALPLVLVLDDYHVIEHSALHAALAFLLDHRPPGLTLVLLSRADPPLPLARLRAQNELLELRADALRFLPDEAESFFNDAVPAGLPSDAAQALQARAEGWIAGLQMAALALPGAAADQADFVRGFTGSHRFVLDYLMEEVLSRQPEAARQFLLATSVLRRFNGALCEAVTGRPGGQAMLQQLERDNVFLVPLDESRQWYRYHHLFADLLYAQLLAESPAAVSSLRQRAAAWHAGNNLPEDAVEYALAAPDFELAAQLLAGPAAGVAARGQAGTLLRWYHAFPAEVLARYPALGWQFGLAFALNGHWDEAQALLAALEHTPGFDPHAPRALMLAYLVAAYRQDRSRLAAIGATAAAAAAAAAGQPDGETLLVQALVASLGEGRGDLAEACRLLSESQAAADRSNSRGGDEALALTALFHHCRLRVYLGDLRRARELCQLALARSRALGDAAAPMALFAHVSLGRIFIEWNDPALAQSHLADAIRLGELSGFATGMLSSATLMQAEAAQARGDAPAALAAAEAGLALAERYDPPSEVVWLRVYQARLWLAQGQAALAAEWLRQPGNTPPALSLFYPSAIFPLTQARVLLAQRQAPAALQLLSRLAAGPRGLLSVEILAVLALARQAQGDAAQARLALDQALALAAPENRLRAFLDLGAPVARLLADCLAHGDLPPARRAFAQTVLALLPAPRPVDAEVGPLSARELAVLRLIVAGQSNDEIARTLTLALSTVKWYVNTLFGKLHVKNRAQAIARTRELKLLPD